MSNELLDYSSLTIIEQEETSRKITVGFIILFGLLQVFSQLQGLYELIYGSHVLRIISWSYPEVFLFLLAGMVTTGIGGCLYFNRLMIWSAVVYALLTQALSVITYIIM